MSLHLMVRYWCHGNIGDNLRYECRLCRLSTPPLPDLQLRLGRAIRRFLHVFVWVQVGIRDSWDNQDAPVQKAIKNLKEVIGVGVSVNPEWPLLFTELDSFYPDKATLVPSVATVVEACCTALATFADDDANGEWADTLLEQTEGRVRFALEIFKTRDIGLIWSNQRRSFVIGLPKSVMPSKSYMLSFFTGNLLKIFDEKPNHSTPPNTQPTSIDDWADVALDNKTGNAAVIEIPQRHAVARESPTFDIIPDIETVARPDELLLKPPYHLTVRDYNSSTIVVQCSHSPTLQFLSDYLTKWARTNHNNTRKPPLAEIKLQQSAFGLGVAYDRLTVTADTRYTAQEISPTILLALIEGVLGYEIVSNDGSLWTFRRDVEFRNNRY
ncbi:hypothetical protein GQX73_g1622 [Xylaria multiplex]|uniref:Uncharacterized protein n=1 Tax=Xylaria multiplex TaxID=323545 RepID=A0A7C8J242_9PEZI|nr:hypothetical protein GQX73_g1622 [Xylaria multiplex]